MRRKQKPMTKVIAGDEPIGRHRWLNFAVAAPALQLVSGGAAAQQRFAFRQDGPELAWTDGLIVVTGVTEPDLEDLRAVAAQLGGEVRDAPPA